MTKLLLALLVLLSMLLASADAAEQVLFQSGKQQVALIELFTAEGCSSCPPAEAWLSKLATQPGLWKEFVPVAFHVDYWDKRGWKDNLASPVYTQRQRAYVATWKSGAAYTPAFAINGREMHSPALPSSSGADAGTLQVMRGEGGLTISYKPGSVAGEWDAHAALLGSGLNVKVSAGENAGHELRHDFVVLKYERMPMNHAADGAQANVSLGTSGSGGRNALAVWVTARGQLNPTQATGGWLSAR